MHHRLAAREVSRSALGGIDRGLGKRWLPGASSLIISHKHKFIFFAVPKTGTHSVRRAIRLHLGGDDQEQVGMFGRKQFNFPQLEQFKSGHVSVLQIKPVLGERVFDSYFKFAFVRNPLDRFVSYCAFSSRESGDFLARPHEYMKYVLREMMDHDNLLLRPQSSFLVDESGRLAMDFIGRVESMQASYATICEKIGIEPVMLDTINMSRHASYRDYYTDELYDAVTSVYADDIALLGYDRVELLTPIGRTGR